MNKLGNERGSVTVFTLTVVLFFTIVLMGIYVTANNANKAQENADKLIIDKYEEDVNLINEIYNEKLNEYNKINKVYVTLDKESIQYTDENHANISVKIDIYDTQADINLCKGIKNDSKEKIGVNSDEWNSNEAFNITNNNGSISTNVETKEDCYIHVLITKLDGEKYEYVSKNINISNQIQ